MPKIIYFYDCICVFAASAQGARRGRRPSMQEAIDVSKFDKKLYSGVRSFDQTLYLLCVFYTHLLKSTAVSRGASYWT